jgi:hypothetical protein
LREIAKKKKFLALQSALKSGAKAQAELERATAARPQRQKQIDSARQKLNNTDERVEG